MASFHVTRPTRPLIIALLLTLLVAPFSVVTATTASAKTGDKLHGGEGTSPHHGKPDGHSQFTPSDPPSDLTVDACGTRVTVSVGDVFKVVERTTKKKNGTLTEYKGPYTADLVAADGRSANEVDNSGRFSEFDGFAGSVRFEVSAPSLLFPTSDEEAAVFRAAGLPTNFYFNRGTFIDTFAHDGSVTIQQIPRNAVSICALLKPQRT